MIQKPNYSTTEHLPLPLLTSKPSYILLRTFLERLLPSLPSWTSSLPSDQQKNFVDPVPWLSRLIATPLPWLTADEAEEVISLASKNIALRAGRSALPDITRSFTVERRQISLFEPGWTGDALGHKTWGTSLLLARRMSLLDELSQSPYLKCRGTAVRCLGLGEGTGLVGIAAAKIREWRMLLTDLPEITENLTRNVENNDCGGNVEVKALDWMDPPGEEEIPISYFEVIIASDLFYDAHHPQLVVKMMERYLKQDPHSRIIVEYPLRPMYQEEISDFQLRMLGSFEIENTGEETGRDDWDIDVHCRWAIYKLKFP